MPGWGRNKWHIHGLRPGNGQMAVGQPSPRSLHSLGSESSMSGRLELGDQ
jgi:hypothetical protein